MTKLEKGKCLCNMGCVRVGNKTQQEAIDCRKECPCDNCDEDIRQLCFKQFIIDNDTSLYGFEYHGSNICLGKKEKCKDQYSGKLLCNFDCKDICTETEIQWCKDNIPCDSCTCRNLCIKRKNYNNAK